MSTRGIRNGKGQIMAIDNGTEGSSGVVIVRYKFQ